MSEVSNQVVTTLILIIEFNELGMGGTTSKHTSRNNLIIVRVTGYLRLEISIREHTFFAFLTIQRTRTTFFRVSPWLSPCCTELQKHKSNW